MTNELKEAMSALADDEMVPGRRGEALDALVERPELQQAWARYHLIGEVMRGAASSPGDCVALHTRVREALAQEPVSLEAHRVRSSLRKPVAGFALAASVAAVAILGVRGIDEPQTPTRTVSEVQQPRATLPAAVLTSGNRWNVEQPAVESRLNGYLVNHSEYAGYGVQGMLPYARIVGYDTVQER